MSQIHHPLVQQAGLQLFIKREDLNHPHISGNKWWKLKYNLREATAKSYSTILTYGGAYSNHIYATAAAASELPLKSIGVIRGEKVSPLNRTLQFAVDNGMKLHYISRAEYRDINSQKSIDILKEKFGEFYRIPEGGTNMMAVRGCEEFAKHLNQITADFICLPVGTGGTIAGIIKEISEDRQILGFSVLKNGAFLQGEIEKLSGPTNRDNWKLLTQYAYGGYGKRDATIDAFIKTFYEHTQIPLDFVYTGKMMCGIFDLIQDGYFTRGTTILAIHTGGLQGHS